MNLSLADTKVILNEHEVKGWSEDTGSLTLPDAFEFSTVRRGATGDMAVFSNGDRGGPVSLSLLPTSPSVSFFMKQITNILVSKARVIWEGSVVYSPTGARVDLKRGTLMSGPLGLTMGKADVGNLTFTWEFEEIIPDFSNVKSDPEPEPVVAEQTFF